MTRRWKIPLLAFAALVVLIAGYMAYLYARAGELRTLHPHFAGTCEKVPGLVGAEDITFDPRSSTAYVSSDDRRAAMEGRQAPGAIFAYDPATPATPPRNLIPGAGPSFHPHGIAVRVTEDGRTLLFVVNHRRASPAEDPVHAIEIFERTGDGPFVHRRSVESELLISPNDVAAVGDDRFYVTNDHGSAPGFGRKMEDIFRLRGANVLYFDGQRLRVVAEDLRYANGVALSRDGNKVFVATVTSFEIAVFRRDAASGALTPARVIEVSSAPDNIELDEDGDLWVAAHPKLLSFVAYSRDADERSPSQVLRLQEGESGHEVSEVFLSEGDDLSGSSVAARRGEHLLIGSVFDPHILRCRMAPTVE